jgi:hypothetical protein
MAQLFSQERQYEAADVYYLQLWIPPRATDGILLPGRQCQECRPANKSIEIYQDTINRFLILLMLITSCLIFP